MNQDAFQCSPRLSFFAIADGLGGHAAGEVAARLALDTLAKELGRDEARVLLAEYADSPELKRRRAVFGLLETAVQRTNAAIIQAGERDDALGGMGATLDLVLLARDRGFFAHVGDSRAYLARATTTLQLTNDHAAYDSLRHAGKRARPQRRAWSPLTNSLGHRKQVIVDTLFVDLARGDRVVLCTDGVHGAMRDETQFAAICRQGDAKSASRALVRHAEAQGSVDDATAIVVTVGERFVERQGEAGPRTRDISTVATSPLLGGLPPAYVLSTLAAAVEVELPAGAEVPHAVASDRVAYLIVDGSVSLPDGRVLGPSGLLLAESLLDMPYRGQRLRVLERSRLLRIRHDDFGEVCANNTQLAAELYKRIARHLASAHP